MRWGCLILGRAEWGWGMNSLTATSDVNPARRRSLTRFGRADSEHVFRAAVRHSRHVRIMRLGIPAAVVLVVVGGIMATLVQGPLRALAKLPVDVGSLVVSGTKIMMQQPRLSGFTRDNRRYDLTAQAAGQDLTKPDLVELHGIQAIMEMQDQAVYETTAKTGLYDTKSELLTLNTNIVVTSSSGYQALLSEAFVDIKAGKIVSEKPVEVKTDAWIVNANRMEIVDSGNLMRFERGVDVVLLPETRAPVASAEVRRR
jgi:lipopolysaccharide export system protein LptC